MPPTGLPVKVLAVTRVARHRQHGSRYCESDADGVGVLPEGEELAEA
jgi:hypothetical protein